MLPTIVAAPEVRNCSTPRPPMDPPVDAEKADDEHAMTENPPPRVPSVEVLAALELLARRAGAQGMALPSELGRPLLRLESLLADSPAPVSATASPLEVAMVLERLLRSAAAVSDLVGEEADVLGVAVQVDLSGMPLVHLLALADAILGLSMAPRSAASWGQPDAAEAAETVLQVAADDLRASAREHAALYRRYTEYVWDVPSSLLQAGQHRWRFIARARLAQRLRAVSRTDRFPRGLTAAAREILEVRAVRARLVSMSPLLTRHLAELDHGPLSDVDAALAAVGAVRRLQRVLGDRLVPARLERMLLAEAFASPDVLSPAVNLRNAVLAWQHDVITCGGDPAEDHTWGDLRRWAEACRELLPVLREGQAAAARLGIDAPTLRALIDVLVLREHVEDLIEVDPGMATGGAA